MHSKRFLIQFQYLGFRYHGLQKQVAFKSIQGVIEDTLSKKFTNFSTRFSSRTDAMVSAREAFFLLMFDEACEQAQIEEVLKTVTADIKILQIEPVEDKFTIQKIIKSKEYHYYFSFGETHNHPFSAPFMTHIHENLDIELMKKGAALFQGAHHFENYAWKPKADASFKREIASCEIVLNDFFTASFFPATSFALKITGHGFLRGQVRLITGTLFRLGMGEINLEDIEHSLKEKDESFVKWLAPPSGLILHKTQLF